MHIDPSKCSPDLLGGARALLVRYDHPQSYCEISADIKQSIRSYATEASKGGSSSTPYIVGGLAIAAGYGGYTFLGKNSPASADAPSTKKEAEKLDKRAFIGGDQGFIDLKLKEAKEYNHNTKSFIFELPESDQVSGMHVACKQASQVRGTLLTYA